MNYHQPVPITSVLIEIHNKQTNSVRYHNAWRCHVIETG